MILLMNEGQRTLNHNIMKKILATISFILLAAVIASAQVDRTHAPKADPAPEVNIGVPDTFTLSNGLKIFVVEDHKTPRITASLILKVDPVLEKDKVGYVSMAGDILRRGTTSRTKEQLDEEIDFLGGNVSTGSRSASCSSLSGNFSKIFSLMADVVLHPSFPAAELEKIRKQTLSGLASAKDEPESILSNVVNVVTYGKDHPYGEVETEETVKNITLDDLKQYYNTYWKPNIGYMALVGDITLQKAKALVQQYFGSWQPGEVPQHDYPVPMQPDKITIAVVNRPASVQTNINIIDPVVLKPGQAVNFPALLMNNILGGGSTGWLFQDLREKYGYTYGAYSSLSNDPLVGSFSASAAVRTAVTDSALMRFMYEMKRIRNEEVSLALLDSVKNTVSGQFAISLESPSRIAQFALNIAMYHMPADYYRNYLKSIAAVSVQDIQAAARRFVTPDKIHIVMVGNAADFADRLSSFGAVQYYDNYGNPVAAPQEKSLPAGLTAGKVIDQYLDAVGGKNKLQSVHDLTIEAEASIAGNVLQIEQKFLLPDHYFMNMSMQGRSLSRVLVKGDEVSAEQMGQASQLDDKTRNRMKAEARPFPELDYQNGQYTLKLTGIEQVNNADAYVVEITGPDGQEKTDYYDVNSGLKVRETTKSAAAGQTADLSDYRMVDGIKIPYHIVMNMGPQKLDAQVKDVKVNSGLKQEDF